MSWEEVEQSVLQELVNLWLGVYYQWKNAESEPYLINDSNAAAFVHANDW